MHFRKRLIQIASVFVLAVSYLGTAETSYAQDVPCSGDCNDDTTKTGGGGSSSGCTSGGPGSSACTISNYIANCSVTCQTNYYACCSVGGPTCSCIAN